MKVFESFSAAVIWVSLVANRRPVSFLAIAWDGPGDRWTYDGEVLRMVRES